MPWFGPKLSSSHCMWKAHACIKIIRSTQMTSYDLGTYQVECDLPISKCWFWVWRQGCLVEFSQSPGPQMNYFVIANYYINEHDLENSIMDPWPDAIWAQAKLLTSKCRFGTKCHSDQATLHTAQHRPNQACAWLGLAKKKSVPNHTLPYNQARHMAKYG